MLGFGPPQALDDWAPALQVLGDIGAVIEELAQRLRDQPRADWDVAELDRLRREGAARCAGDGLTARVVRLAREATPAGTIATVDAGQHHACVASAWPAVAPREFLSSNGLATAGFSSLPIKERGALGVREFLRVLGARAAGRLGWSPSS